MTTRARLRAPAAFAIALCLAWLPVANGGQTKPATNLFDDPGFEMGAGGYRMDKGKGTTAAFKADAAAAFEGQRSALVTIESVGDYGTQFGQLVDGGQVGKTYTFAVFARSEGEPTQLQLEIERPAKPWDRAVRSDKLAITKDKWAELHVTFKVEKPFAEGWFAYVSCNRPNVAFRVDAFRLYEGDYTPYKEAVREVMATAGVRLFDTGTPSPAPIAPDALAKHDGWTQVPEGATAHAFKGDAVLLNDKLALALRRSGRGAELYGVGAKGHALRAVLAPTGAGRAAKLASLKIVENSPAGVGLDAAFASDDGKPLAINLDLRMGQPFVRSEARGGAAGVRLEAPCRYAVLPDFFADDIVVSAAELPVERAELPSEHFLLHLLGDGEAIAMAVWNVSQEDVQVALSGKGAERRLDASDIRFGDKGRVWAAVLEAPAIWHVHDVAKADAGKIVRLGWKPPYPAAWRLDWRCDDNLTGSWEMLLEKAGGYFEKPGWFGSPGRLPPDRKRWTTVLGSFQYPCWIDRSGEACIQPLTRGATFQGPAVAYPISRVSATPLDAFTVVDIVRGTLGVGPCEYILDLEGQQSRNKGRATCSTRDTLGDIYAKKEQKKRRAEIEQVLIDVMAFIRYIRGRIETYVDFGHGLLKYLADQKQAHPDLAQPIGELEGLTKRIDAFVEARRSHIKTVDAAAELAEEFKKNVLDYDGPDALDRCKKITVAWVDIGGNQDELAGECRMAVKWVRQRAGLLMAADPRMADIAKEIRSRTQKVLRNPAGHEGARH